MSKSRALVPKEGPTELTRRLLKEGMKAKQIIALHPKLRAMVYNQRKKLEAAGELAVDTEGRKGKSLAPKEPPLIETIIHDGSSIPTRFFAEPATHERVWKKFRSAFFGSQK